MSKDRKTEDLATLELVPSDPKLVSKLCMDTKQAILNIVKNNFCDEVWNAVYTTQENNDELPSNIVNLRQFNTFLTDLYFVMDQVEDGSYLNLPASLIKLYNNLFKFDLKAGKDTRLVLSLLQRSQPELWQQLVAQVPQLDLYAGIVTKQAKTDAERLDFLQDLLIEPRFVQGMLDNKQYLDKMAVEIAPELKEEIQNRTVDEQYVITEKDSNTAKAIKQVSNLLIAHTSMLIPGSGDGVGFLFDLVDNGKVLIDLVMKIDIGAAMKDKTGEGLERVISELTLLKPVFREFCLLADAYEDRYQLKDGRILNILEPYIQAYQELAKHEKVGIVFDADDDNCYAGARKAARQARYQASQDLSHDTYSLQEIIKQFAKIDSTPLAWYTPEKLVFLRDNAKHLLLPQELKVQFLAEIDSALKNDYSQESYFAKLSRLAGYLTDMTNYKEEVGRHVATLVHDVQVELNDQAFFQRVLENRAIAPDAQVELHEAGDLVERAKAIQAKNFEVKNAIKAVRLLYLDQLTEDKLSKPVFDVLNRSIGDGVFVIKDEDAATDILDLAETYNLLVEFEALFPYEHQSYASAISHALKLKNIIGKLNFFGDTIALTSEIWNNTYKAMMELKPDAVAALNDGLGFDLAERIEAVSAIPAEEQQQLPAAEQTNFEYYSDQVVKFLGQYQEEGEAVSIQETYKNISDNITLIVGYVDTYLIGLLPEETRKCFVKNDRGFYDINTDDKKRVLVEDLKNVLNAIQNAKIYTDLGAEKNVMDHLPTVVGYLNKATLSLCNITLADSHAHLQNGYRKFLKLMRDMHGKVVTPRLKQLVLDVERLEETARSRQGALGSRRVAQYVEKLYSPLERIGFAHTEETVGGFAKARREARATRLATAEATLTQLQDKFKVLDALKQAHDPVAIKNNLKVLGLDDSKETITLLDEIIKNPEILNVNAFDPFQTNEEQDKQDAIISEFEELLARIEKLHALAAQKIKDKRLDIAVINDHTEEVAKLPVPVVPKKPVNAENFEAKAIPERSSSWFTHYPAILYKVIALFFLILQKLVQAIKDYFQPDESASNADIAEPITQDELPKLNAEDFYAMPGAGKVNSMPINGLRIFDKHRGVGSCAAEVQKPFDHSVSMRFMVK